MEIMMTDAELTKTHNSFIQGKELDNRKLFSQIEQNYNKLDETTKSYMLEVSKKMHEYASMENDDVKFDFSQIESLSDEDLHRVSTIVSLYKDFARNDLDIAETKKLSFCCFGSDEEEKADKMVKKFRTTIRIVDNFNYSLSGIVHERFVSSNAENKEKMNAILKRRRGNRVKKFQPC